MTLAKVTIKDLKSEWSKLITFFKERDNYRLDLRKAISRYGVANLPASVQRTIPTDMKVLYEVKWWLQPGVWTKLIATTIVRAQNEGVRRALHG